MVAVRRTGTAEAVAEILRRAPEPLDLFSGRRGDGPGSSSPRPAPFASPRISDTWSGSSGRTVRRPVVRGVDVAHVRDGLIASVYALLLTD